MTKTWTHIASEFQDDLATIYPKEEIHQLFLIVFEHITGDKSMVAYHAAQKDLVSSATAEKAQDILQQLKSQKPIQHILGEAYFYGHMLEVSEHTLIPRSETEELVHLILKENNTKSDLRIIDIGTGTGCIPIALAKRLKGDYTAVELSSEAIQVAKRNAKKYQSNIKFIQADILEWELFFPSEEQYDIIVSNPPYITPKEKLEMHANVLHFEPHLALFVEEEAPLLFYDYIADFALVHLSTNGILYFEINQYLSQQTSDLLKKKGFQEVEIIQDINAADRIIRAKK